MLSLDSSHSPVVSDLGFGVFCFFTAGINALAPESNSAWVSVPMEDLEEFAFCKKEFYDIISVSRVN